jgi:hypothetical protein
MSEGAAPGEMFLQPKITGYRQLSKDETALINEGKLLAEMVGQYIGKLRLHPMTPAGAVPVLPAFDELCSIDQRWVSIGATQLQQGFMAVIRGIAQPTTF